MVRLVVVLLVTATGMMAASQTAHASEPVIWENPDGSTEILYENGYRQSFTIKEADEAVTEAEGILLEGGATGQKASEVPGYTERAGTVVKNTINQLLGRNKKLYEDYKYGTQEQLWKADSGFQKFMTKGGTIPDRATLLKYLGNFTWGVTAFSVGFWIGEHIFDPILFGGTKEVAANPAGVEAVRCVKAGGCEVKYECSTAYHFPEGALYLVSSVNAWCVTKGFLTSLAPCWKPSVNQEPFLPNGAVEVKIATTAGCSDTEGATGAVGGGEVNLESLEGGPGAYHGVGLATGPIGFPGGTEKGPNETQKFTVPAPPKVTPYTPNRKELDTREGEKGSKITPVVPSTVTTYILHEQTEQEKREGATTVTSPNTTLPFVPKPNPGESGTKYKERLEREGWTKVSVNTLTEAQANTYPSAGPEGVVYTSPSEGTYTELATPISVEQDPGTQSATTEAPALFYAPHAELKIPTFGVLCKNFPFGVPCWIVNLIENWSAVGKAPTLEVPIMGRKMSINLAVIEPAMEVIRPVFAISGIVGLVVTFFSFAIGGAGGVASGGDD